MRLPPPGGTTVKSAEEIMNMLEAFDLTVPASLLPGSSARCATRANTTRSTASPSRRRPCATRRIATPIPSRSQTRSNVHAPPRCRQSRISTSAPAAALTACCGVRNREIDDTRRANAARSTFLSPSEVVDHLRDRVARLRAPLVVSQLQSRRPPTHPGSSDASPAGTCPHSTAQDLPCRATRRKSCAYKKSCFRNPQRP